jgi:hypothetical protein
VTAIGKLLQHKTVVVLGRGDQKACGSWWLGETGTGLPAPTNEPGITAETADVTDDTTIAALAGRVSPVDHVVSTAQGTGRAYGTIWSSDVVTVEKQ